MASPGCQAGAIVALGLLQQGGFVHELKKLGFYVVTEVRHRDPKTGRPTHIDVVILKRRLVFNPVTGEMEEMVEVQNLVQIDEARHLISKEAIARDKIVNDMALREKPCAALTRVAVPGEVDAGTAIKFTQAIVTAAKDQSVTLRQIDRFYNVKDSGHPITLEIRGEMGLAPTCHRSSYTAGKG
jgi:hypothetical protein